MAKSKFVALGVPGRVYSTGGTVGDARQGVFDRVFHRGDVDARIVAPLRWRGAGGSCGVGPALGRVLKSIRCCHSVGRDPPLAGTRDRDVQPFCCGRGCHWPPRWRVGIVEAGLCQGPAIDHRADVREGVVEQVCGLPAVALGPAEPVAATAIRRAKRCRAVSPASLGWAASAKVMDGDRGAGFRSLWEVSVALQHV